MRSKLHYDVSPGEQSQLQFFLLVINIDSDFSLTLSLSHRACYWTRGYSRIHDGSCTGVGSCKDASGNFVIFQDGCTGPYSCTGVDNNTVVHEGSCTGKDSCSNSEGDFIVYKNGCTDVG